MARNRKRAKERQPRQPVVSGRVGDGGQTPRSRELSNGSGEGAQEFELEPAGDGAPNPIEHAAPDAELAKAELARGAEIGPEEESDLDDELEEGNGAVAEVARPTVTHAAPRAWLGARLLAFLEGSWREHQRVQWPDRRQVMQATGVVIGFVIVAAVFLGLADLVATKVVSFVINGK